MKYIELRKGEKIPKSYDTFYPTLDKLSDGGMLVGTKLVILDFDAHNEEEQEKLHEIENYIITKYNTFWVQGNRGKHIYFRKPSIIKSRKIGEMSVLGFKCDYLTGRNQVEVLKQNGKKRKTSSKDFDIDLLPDLPEEFYPIPKSRNNNMLCMKDGMGRNETLYKHLLCVKESSNVDIKKVATFINDYVFSEKLTEKELNTIIESATNKEVEDHNFYDGKTIDVSEFAKYLIKNEHIVKINNQLYIFNGEVYVNGRKYIESAMIKYIPNILSAKRTEVYKMIELLLSNEDSIEYADPKYIAFKNGIYEIESKQLLEFNPDIVITNQIPWNYNPNADNKEIYTILNNWVGDDKELFNLLTEVIGICMYRSNAISSCFILTGNKDNGKSTFIWLLKSLLGENNYSSISLHSIERRFMNADIVGKLANLGDDIGDEYISRTEIFKKLVTGETVQLEKKGQDPFDYDNYGKLIFNANDIPRIKDPTGAVIDKRITYLPFNTVFTGKKKDPNLKNKFKSNNSLMETLILIGIKGIERVLENNGFTESKASMALKEEYKFKNDPISQFIDEYGEDKIYLFKTNDVHRRYKNFCEDNNYEYVNHVRFYRKICEKLGCETVRRKEKVNNIEQKNRYFTEKLS